MTKAFQRSRTQPREVQIRPAQDAAAKLHGSKIGNPAKARYSAAAGRSAAALNCPRAFRSGPRDHDRLDIQVAHRARPGPRRIWGARAGDLSAALDQVLADPAFAASIDPKKIYAVGFSPGGGTVLGLGGARLDGKVQQANCTKGPEAADCWFFQPRGVDFSKAKGFSDDMRDTRIKRIVAVDPGPIGSIVPTSLTAMPPVHLINLGEGADRMSGTLSRKPPSATLLVGAPMYGLLSSRGYTSWD